MLGALPLELAHSLEASERSVFSASVQQLSVEEKAALVQ